MPSDSPPHVQPAPRQSEDWGRQESFAEALASLEAAHDREVAKLQSQLQFARTRFPKGHGHDEAQEEGRRSTAAHREKPSVHFEEAQAQEPQRTGAARWTNPSVLEARRQREKSKTSQAEPGEKDAKQAYLSDASTTPAMAIEAMPPSKWSMQRTPLGVAVEEGALVEKAADGDLCLPRVTVKEPEDPDDPASYQDWLRTTQCEEVSVLQRWEVLTGKLRILAETPRNDILLRSHNWEILPVWTLCRSAAREGFNQAVEKVGASDVQVMTSKPVDTRTGDTNTDPTSIFQPFVIHPHSVRILTWRILGALAILMDCILIPLGSFDLEDLEFPVKVVTTVTSIYWLLDLILCFFTGEEIEGVVELRPRAVAMRYLSSWFLPDVAILMLDLAMVLMEEEDALGMSAAPVAARRLSGLLGRLLQPVQNMDASNAATSVANVRLIKVLRLVRMVRLVRIMKLQQVKNNVLYRLNNGALILAFKITGMVLAILALNHYVACLWYAVGLFNTSDEVTWIKEFNLAEEGFKMQYSASLHWALTQFAPATNNIAPQNLAERSFAIFVVLFAMIVFSSFISSVTNAVNQLRAINMERIKDESRILEFIAVRKINSRLAIKIHRFVKENYKRCRTRVHETDIPLFAEIPESMRIQLHEQMFMHHLHANPMLSPFVGVDRPLALKICHMAFSESSYVPRQDVFVEGFEAKTVYVVVGGVLEYSSIFYNYEPQEIHAGEWVSEMAIWVNWSTRGQCTAMGTCELALLDCMRFQILVNSNGGPMLLCLRKLALFLASYCEAEEHKFAQTISSNVVEAKPSREPSSGSVKTTLPITDLAIPASTMQDLADRARRLFQMRTDIGLLISGPSRNGTVTSGGSPHRHASSHGRFGRMASSLM